MVSTKFNGELYTMAESTAESSVGSNCVRSHAKTREEVLQEENHKYCLRLVCNDSELIGRRLTWQKPSSKGVSIHFLD